MNAPIAREYLRVSQDSSGRLKSPEEQHGENQEAADECGWTFGAAYRESEAISASKFSKALRPEFLRLISDLQTGQFGAAVLVLWEFSRGSRRAGESVLLADLCEEAGILIHVTSHGRTYDVRKYQDRKALLTEALDAEAESSKTSLRILRSTRSQAKAGRPHGHVGYGYLRTYKINDQGRKEITGQPVVEAEGAILLELNRRIRRGESMRSIDKRFWLAGYRTRTGKRFSAQHLRDLALNPVYAGLRVHRPGATSGERYTGDLTGAWEGKVPGVTPGTWEAIIPWADFLAAREILLDPARRTSRPGRGKHLLSMIAVCDDCGGALTATNRRKQRTYQCRNGGHVNIPADHLDAYAEALILAYLAEDDVIDRLRTEPDDSPELIQVRADLSGLRGDLSDWQRLALARKVTPESFAMMEAQLLADIERLEAREKSLTTPRALLHIEPGKDVALRWAAADVAARRQVARLICSPPFLGQLRLMHAPAPGSRIAAEHRARWAREDVAA